jgi:hypothetical protein
VTGRLERLDRLSPRRIRVELRLQPGRRRREGFLMQAP